MDFSKEEQHFIKHWEEQRKGGKNTYMATYTLGFFIMYFMMGVAIGLFSQLRFVTKPILIGLAVVSLLLAAVTAWLQWRKNENKYNRMLKDQITRVHPN